jgi:hypothetical protein
MGKLQFYYDNEDAARYPHSNAWKLSIQEWLYEVSLRGYMRRRSMIYKVVRGTFGIDELEEDDWKYDWIFPMD